MADYHSLLMRAVANLPNAGTPATRGAIYGRARKALLEQLRSLRPPLPESDITREEKALDAAIAEIEEQYGPQGDAPLTAAAPAPAGKPGAPPSKAAPPAAPAQPAATQRPVAPPAPVFAAPARSPSPTGAPGQADARSGNRSAAPSVADAGAGSACREPAASANSDRGKASRSGADGGFARSIPAGRCNGQPALLRTEDRPGRSAGRGEGRQG